MIDEKKLIEDLEMEWEKEVFRVDRSVSSDWIYQALQYKRGAYCYATAIHLVRTQPKVGEWIPVSERLPNCNGCYLVWRPHFFGGEIGMSAICYFDGQDTWHDSYGVDFTRILNKEDVIAWMPLPEAYRKDGE